MLQAFIAAWASVLMCLGRAGHSPHFLWHMLPEGHALYGGTSTRRFARGRIGALALTVASYLPKQLSEEGKPGPDTNQ